MYNKFGKRILDIVLASSALIILAIPMVIISVWVKFDSKGPALFRQLRSGKNRNPFTVYKFRTMSTDAPSDMPTNSFKNSHMHITRSGKIMRKLSLDELPQLFNVIRGDMSVVGPRPVLINESNLLMLREAVGANHIKPGITGWAQVNGRDELDDIIKAQMDGFYVKHFSLLLDLKCLMLTFVAVLFVKGHKEGHEANVIDSVNDIDQELLINKVR
jgi:lipopolysaccharide/colanic/teichoic acid biosynthesis glycosyltransferase